MFAISEYQQIIVIRRTHGSCRVNYRSLCIQNSQGLFTKVNLGLQRTIFRLLVITTYVMVMVLFFF